jgi:hypothetical protein
MKKKTPMLFASTLLALAGSAGAAVIVTGTSNNSGFVVSAADLLQTQLGGNGTVVNNLTINTGENNAWSGPGPTFNTSPIATAGSLTDGVFATTNHASAGSYVIASGSITYNLDTSINTLGYDIQTIGIYTGWLNDGRDRVDVTVSFATVLDPGTFVPLGLTTQDGGGQYESAVISESVSPNLLATGVKSIRFNFGASQENGGSGYKELDVTGVATVPESSSALLGGLGLLALLRRRR